MTLSCPAQCSQCHSPRLPDRRLGSSPRARRRSRRGSGLLEAVFLVPLLLMLFFIALDYARVYFASITIANCARNGALYAADPNNHAQTDPSGLQSAALADASTLTPAPTVTQRTGTETDGSAYVEVTVSYPFHLVCSYLGLSNPLTISRRVRMRQFALQPDTQ
jgi:Flp pilus assembly protein TadG